MNAINRLKNSVKQVPLAVWILIVAAFILGFIIRGGGSSESTEAAHDHSAEQTATIWTCSMHPQIRLPEPGKCPICFMDLIPLETGNSDSDLPTQMNYPDASIGVSKIRITLRTISTDRGISDRISSLVPLRTPGSLSRFHTGLLYSHNSHSSKSDLPINIS